MKFFYFLIIAFITFSCFLFGIGTTFNAIYGENTFWSITFTILIIIHYFIARNKNNYGGENDTFSM